MRNSFSLHIAKRYLFSRRSYNAINIISWISVIGVAFGTMALITVMSAFNGLQELIESLYESFDPDIKIELAEGKSFDETDLPKEKIKQIDGVIHYSEVVEELTLLKYKDNQSIATMKGVDTAFMEMSGLDTMLIDGELKLEAENGNPMAVLGFGIADNLSLYLGDVLSPITIYVPKRGKNVSLNPEKAFNRRSISPIGIFSVNPDFDYKYYLVPKKFAQDLLAYGDRISAVELALSDEINHDEARDKIQEIVGSKYTVKTAYQLNELIFKTSKTEKWITFLILSFILVIAAFNIIGSISMIIMDKQKDIWILKSMGASKAQMKAVFFLEGMFINFIGAIIGGVLAVVLVILQQEFGLIAFEGGIRHFYPVKLLVSDIFYTFLMIGIIGFFASSYPVGVLLRRTFK